MTGKYESCEAGAERQKTVGAQPHTLPVSLTAAVRKTTAAAVFSLDMKTDLF
jgi:hypothetical protein